jgi:predicted acetyltransferase
MAIEWKRAESAQQPVITQLMELYLYEIADILHYDLGTEGRYGCDYLALYWQDSKRTPYLLWIEGKLAGFALVQHLPSEAGNIQSYEMVDFFVVRSWRNRGMAASAAQKLWRMHPGKWQVRCLRDDSKTMQFWHDTISHLTGSSGHLKLHEIGKETWAVYHFSCEHFREIDEEKLDAKLQLHRQIDPAG